MSFSLFLKLNIYYKFVFLYEEKANPSARILKALGGTKFVYYLPPLFQRLVNGIMARFHGSLNAILKHIV